MSNGGSFKLLTNDGKQDDMIMATRLLNARLKKIESFRSNDPRVKDCTPTLVDIEKTHILFVNAHFKPYVAMGYEYQITPASRVQLDQECIYSIPLYGDFIHDMTLHIRLGEVAATNTGPGNRLLKYVDYPGERICCQTDFTVNGNPLDSYTHEVYPFHREFTVAPCKKAGYDRMLGQQETIEASINSRTGRGGPVEKTRLTNGPQTPKAVQPALDLWIPLLFWFCKDVKLSLLSVAIPHGQRFLKFTLCHHRYLLQHCGVTAEDDDPAANPTPRPEIETCELYINNIFVNPEIHNILIRRIGFSLIRVHRLQKFSSNKRNEEILLSQLKWPIETIYTGGKPVENSDSNSSLMCENWHKCCKNVLRTVETSSMNAKAFTVDGAFANDPAQAIDYTNTFVLLNGNPIGINFATELGVAGATVISVDQINIVLARKGFPILSGVFANPLLPTNAEIVAALPKAGVPAHYWEQKPCCDSIGIKAHGIEIFKIFPGSFFNTYLPYHYGSEKILTPTDSGKYFIPFNFYPGSYQPSGHINVSRAREFYFSYSSSTVATESSMDVLFIAIAINFLLISDGSAVLRYST